MALIVPANHDQRPCATACLPSSAKRDRAAHLKTLRATVVILMQLLLCSHLSAGGTGTRTCVAPPLEVPRHSLAGNSDSFTGDQNAFDFPNRDR